MNRIVIVGATSGIGLALARHYANAGLKVAVAGRDESALERVKSEFPGQVVTARIDVSDSNAPKKLQELIGRNGGMDTYIHVSGVGYDNAELDAKKEHITISTNVAGFSQLVVEAFRYFRDRCEGRGHIVAITSVAGTKCVGHMAAYSATKRFQNSYLSGLNQLATLNKLRISFSDIRPGFIRTPLLADDESYPGVMALDYAVPRIVRAIERNRRVAVIDWRWNLLVGLWRIVPNALWVRLPMKVGTVMSRR